MNEHIKNDSKTVIKNLGSRNEKFSGRKILLTGGAGFLGSQFTHYFLSLNDSNTLSKPCHLFCLDNFVRGIPEWIQKIENRKDISVISSDIIKDQNFPDCDYVIHAASIASPIFYRKFPIETMDANVIGLRNLLNFIHQRPCESMLFFSTSEIYGDPFPEYIPTSETYRGNVSCTGPRACYDESKRYGETLCVNFFQQLRLPIKIARPFNNFGPGLNINDGRVLPDFFNDVLNNRDIKLLSDGRATRTFCYVSDAITGYLLLLLSNQNGESFNIGVETPEISMLNLAQLVVKVSGKDLKIHFAQSSDKHYLTDNPQRRCPDISKARTLLDFQPNISLEEGLERTYKYYFDFLNPRIS